MNGRKNFLEKWAYNEREMSDPESEKELGNFKCIG